MKLQISIPKAGSHLFKQMTGSTSIGLLQKNMPTPIEQFKDETDVLGRITDLPEGNYCAHLLHTPAAEFVVSGFDTVILILRDPRDIIISQLYYVKWWTGKAVNYLVGDGLHLSDLSMEDGIDFLIDNFRPVLLGFDKWTSCPFVHVFTFEQYIDNAELVFERLHDLGYGEIDKMREAITIHDKKAFRKGDVGDWVNHFSETQARNSQDNFGDIIDKWAMY